MISLETAQDFVLRDLVPLSVEEVALDVALGCASATDVVAREMVPGFRNSSMDGFALRALDTSTGSGRLRIVDTVLAGRPSSRTLSAGETMRIMTGAALPEGADTVCRIEDVTMVGDDQVIFPRRLDAGECVRLPGDDVRVGQVLLAARAELTAPAVAVIAGQGYSTVLVHRRPVVGVLSTGDELSSAPTLSAGQIRDTNRPLLLALLRATGVTPVDLGVAPDDREEIHRHLSEAVMRCDAVVCTGGVSVGDVDHVKGVIGDLAPGRSHSVQVAIKPAKPFAFGLVGAMSTPIFGLPGNPVSTRVSFELFVRPALRVLGGHRLVERPRVRAVLECALETPTDEKCHFVHVTAHVGDEGRVRVSEAARHNSHLLSAIVAANALAVLEPGGTYAAGDEVDVIILETASLARA